MARFYKAQDNYENGDDKGGLLTTKQAIELITEAKTAVALFGDDKDAGFKRLAKLVHGRSRIKRTWRNR